MGRAVLDSILCLVKLEDITVWLVQIRKRLRKGMTAIVILKPCMMYGQDVNLIEYY